MRSLDARVAKACCAGIVVMVLLLLCGVKREAIVEDYMMSEQVLKQSRMHDELDLDGACVGACPDDPCTGWLGPARRERLRCWV